MTAFCGILWYVNSSTRSPIWY